MQATREISSMDRMPIQERDDGVVIRCRVHPAARKTDLTGLHDGRIRVSVTAPADKGRANAALRKYLARRLDVAAARVRILRGHTDRNKDVFAAGVSLEQARSCLLPDEHVS